MLRHERTGDGVRGRRPRASAAVRAARQAGGSKGGAAPPCQPSVFNTESAGFPALDASDGLFPGRREARRLIEPGRPLPPGESPARPRRAHRPERRRTGSLRCARGPIRPPRPRSSPRPARPEKPAGGSTPRPAARRSLLRDRPVRASTSGSRRKRVGAFVLRSIVFSVIILLLLAVLRVSRRSPVSRASRGIASTAQCSVLLGDEREYPVRRPQRRRAATTDLANQVRVAQRHLAERRRAQARTPERRADPRSELLFQRFHA